MRKLRNTLSPLKTQKTKLFSKVDSQPPASTSTDKRELPLWNSINPFTNLPIMSFSRNLFLFIYSLQSVFASLPIK